MNRTVYIGRPDSPRRKGLEHEVGEAIQSNIPAAARLAPEDPVAEIADALRTVDGTASLRGVRYTFGYGVEVRHGSKLLDTVQVLGLRDALNKIEREQKEGCDSITFSVLARGELPGDVAFGGERWDRYGFVIVEEFDWGPLMSSVPAVSTASKTKHRITPRRIAELLTLTTNSQIGLQTGVFTTFGTIEQKLLRGIVDTKVQFGIQLPTDMSFGLTRPSEKEIYEWHVRANRWEQEFERFDVEFGVLVGEATKGHLAWKLHDDEKEIMALARCLEAMWATGGRGNKREKIRKGCRKWMTDRNQNEAEISSVIELLNRFYDRNRNVQAHEATGQAFQTDVERAHLNARIRGLIEDYLWWNLAGEWTNCRPKVVSRGEEGGTHKMLWTQMWTHWKDRGLSIDEIMRLWT